MILPERGRPERREQANVRRDFQLSHNRCARTAEMSCATADESTQGIFRKEIR